MDVERNGGWSRYGDLVGQCRCGVGRLTSSSIRYSKSADTNVQSKLAGGASTPAPMAAHDTRCCPEKRAAGACNPVRSLKRYVVVAPGGRRQVGGTRHSSRTSSPYFTSSPSAPSLPQEFWEGDGGG